MNNKNLTQSLCRAFDIINCFVTEESELRVSDIANMLGLTPSNVSRLLATMVSYDYIEKVNGKSSYRLGKEIIKISSVALNNFEIRKQSLPEMYKLEDKYGLGVNLAILRNNEIFYLAHVDSRTSPRMYTMIGYSNPIYCTALGKILIAYKQNDEIDDMIDKIEFVKKTSHTIDNKEKFVAELSKVIKNGYAIEKEEQTIGRCCIAAPIRNVYGSVVASISLSGDKSHIDLDTKEEELSQIIINCANYISSKMGSFI